MPTKGREVDALVDTSTAIAVVVEDHELHGAALRAIGKRAVGLAGHAAFETFSVLTRLPPPTRRSPEAVARILHANFPSIKYLSATGSDALLELFAELGIAGGSVYDALVGAAAAESGLILLTCDARAVPVYRALQVDIEVIKN